MCNKMTGVFTSILYCTKFTRQENFKVQSCLYSTILFHTDTGIHFPARCTNDYHCYRHSMAPCWASKWPNTIPRLTGKTPLPNPVRGRHKHPRARFSPSAVCHICWMQSNYWKLRNMKHGGSVFKYMEKVYLNTWREVFKRKSYQKLDGLVYSRLKTITAFLKAQNRGPSTPCFIQLQFCPASGGVQIFKDYLH